MFQRDVGNLMRDDEGKFVLLPSTEIQQRIAEEKKSARQRDCVGGRFAVNGAFKRAPFITQVSGNAAGNIVEQSNLPVIGEDFRADAKFRCQARAEVNLRTQGLVFHATPWFSLLANHSTNFALPTLNQKTLPNDPVPQPRGETSEGRTAATNATVRTVFLIGPDKKIKLILVYPMTTGRNFDEVLRVIDSLQLTAKNKVSTPAQWHPGEDVIIAGSVSNDEAKELFGDWEEPKPYIRIVPQPKG